MSNSTFQHNVSSILDDREPRTTLQNGSETTLHSLPSFEGPSTLHKSLSDSHASVAKGMHSDHIEDASQPSQDEPPPSAPPSPDDARLRPIYRKLDIRIVAWYSFVYTVFKVSERNITNVRIINAETPASTIVVQLGDITSEQWSWIVSSFFYTHVVFEPVSTILLKKFNPNVWMARIMITWGIISCCQAATQNYGGLVACRVLLGLAEAGFMASVLYHCSFWYPASMLTFRISLLAGCAMFSGTVSGLLAYAISFLNNAAGLAGWRWVFLIEGLPAVILGAITFFCLPNYPQTAKFLTPAQQALILANLPRTQPREGAKNWDWKEVKALVLRDFTFWSFAILWLAHAVGALGVSLALPSVIYGLQLKDSALTQLLTIPPFGLGCVLTLASGFIIQKLAWRAWIWAITLETIVCLCYILLITVQGPYVRYVIVVIALASGMAVLPILWPERIRAARGTTSTGFALGLTSSVGATCGLVGPQIYQHKFGPSYRVSYSICIGLVATAIVCILITWMVVRARERKKDKGIQEVEGEVTGRHVEEKRDGY